MIIKNRNSEATFRIFQRDDKDFAIEVEIPEAPSTTVSGFDTERAAELWIDAFKERVVASQSRRPAYFRNRSKVATEA
jgi:hypothetical protein